MKRGITLCVQFLEKKYQSKFKDVIIDIVAYSKDDIIFIEPFLSSPIDKEKEKKLKDIDITTFSIDLNPFIDFYGWGFKLEKLRKYLISKLYKKWSYLNKNTFKEYLLYYEKHILKMVDFYKDEINEHKQKIEDIKKLEKEYKELNLQIYSLQLESGTLYSNISKLKNEIDYPDFH